MQLKHKELFMPAPQQGYVMNAGGFYVRAQGTEKMYFKTTSTRSDLFDTVSFCSSSDNGKTLSTWEAHPIVFNTRRGKRRLRHMPGFVDPACDRLVRMCVEGVLPSDDPLEGMQQWFLHYQVSSDGGRSWPVDEQVIQKGDYTPTHPCEYVWIGKNCMMIGDYGSRPIITREGRILVPAQFTPLGPDGEHYNPTGAYYYLESFVLVGTWTQDMRIEWDVSERVANDPDKSTRGCFEPTLAQMSDGRILMVMRGSNDKRPELPSYKWASVSKDGGRTWTAPEPWTCTDGKPFFSPSSCSQLMAHSSGRIYWLGNINRESGYGNAPRYPFVIGEVAPESGKLIRESIVCIDNRQHDEPEDLTLSNFMAEEDRDTGEIILYMSRLFLGTWTANAYIYRIEP